MPILHDILYLTSSSIVYYFRLSQPVETLHTLPRQVCRAYHFYDLYVLYLIYTLVIYPTYYRDLNLSIQLGSVETC